MMNRLYVNSREVKSMIYCDEWGIMVVVEKNVTKAKWIRLMKFMNIHRFQLGLTLWLGLKMTMVVSSL
jgi:hypothetical protein